MKLKTSVLLTILILKAPSFACMTNGEKTLTSNQMKKAFKESFRIPTSSIINFSNGNSSPSLESQLGNLLLQKNKEKIILSIPVILEKSSYHPFGDGQSNAKMSLGVFWKQTGFPVIGIQSINNGKIQRQYLFHPYLKITNYKETKLSTNFYKVQPEGWKDSFYFSYESKTLSVNQFLQGIPEKYRTFSENRVAPDVAKVGKGSGIERFKNLGSGYNKEAWFAENVHGVFPDQNGKKTAIGGVLTWGIVDKAYGPFKNLYTCFESRDLAKEKSTGLPSGAGWHLIGDPAESLLNNLSSSAVPAAVAKTHLQNNAAYGLTESITATWLQADEVLISQQSEFHWYLNPYQSSVCTEIWVHNCVPNISNNWGFNCTQ